MSLRTRLIIAFLLLSVVPLTVVTAQHYVSSLDTLHRVARRDAEQMTQELGQRMEVVKADLRQRVEQLWEGNRPQRRNVKLTVPGQSPAAIRNAAMTGMADMLGETAMFLDRIEFRTTPAPPMPPPLTAATPGTLVSGGPAQAPAAAPAAAAGEVAAQTAARPRSPEAFVIDMKALRAE